MNYLEVRVGFENPRLADPRFLNNLCGSIPTASSLNWTSFELNGSTLINVTVECFDGLTTGRFVTVQKFGCGRLEIFEMTIFPVPGIFVPKSHCNGLLSSRLDFI